MFFSCFFPVVFRFQFSFSKNSARVVTSLSRFFAHGDMEDRFFTHVLPCDLREWLWGRTPVDNVGHDAILEWQPETEQHAVTGPPDDICTDDDFVSQPVLMATDSLQGLLQGLGTCGFYPIFSNQYCRGGIHDYPGVSLSGNSGLGGVSAADSRRRLFSTAKSSLTSYTLIPRIFDTRTVFGRLANFFFVAKCMMRKKG